MSLINANAKWPCCTQLKRRLCHFLLQNIRQYKQTYTVVINFSELRIVSFIGKSPVSNEDFFLFFVFAPMFNSIILNPEYENKVEMR